MTPDEVKAWQKRLEDTFKGPNGIIGERLLHVRGIETAMGARLTSTFCGYLVLMDSFLDFYMESIECIKVRRKEGWPELAPFVTATHITAFQRFRASYLLFWAGYFIDGLSLLRSVFENVLQIAALRHGIVALNDIFGGVTVDEAAGIPPDRLAKQIRSNTIKCDKSIRENLLGAKSGLSTETQEDMEVLQEILHGAVHKSKLNLFRLFWPWIRGEKGMPIYPHYDEDNASLYMNPSQGIGWMVVRTLLSLQIEPGEFPASWQEKYIILDDSFRSMVGAFPKRMGRSVEEVVTKKFNF